MKLEADKSKQLTPVGKIMKHEGYRTEPYKDTEGYLTGGTGHKMTAEDMRNFDTNWSDDEKNNYWADRFEEDYAKASTGAVRLMAKNGIKDNPIVEGVLVNMIFNMGENGVSKFKNFLTALSNEQPDEAVKEMKTSSSGGKSKWYRQVGGRVDELANEIKDAF